MTSAMRTTAGPFLIVFLAALGAVPSGVGCQEPPSRDRPVSGVSLGSVGGSGPDVPHPASLALELWDSLQLTPRQVQDIRGIQDRLEEVLFSLMVAAASSTPPLHALVWSDDSIGEEELRAVFERGAHAMASVVLGFFETRDEVFDVLTHEQGLKLREAHRVRYAQATSPDTPVPPTRPCVVGSSSGGSRVSDRIHLTYSVAFDGNSATIGAVFVGRADVRLHESPSSRGRPELPDGRELTSGTSMGYWYMGYDRRTRTAWVHTQEVPLGDANVVLVDGIDGVHELPRIAGVLQMASPVFTGGCPPDRPWQQILVEELEKVPEIRAFIHPGGSEASGKERPFLPN